MCRERKGLRYWEQRAEANGKNFSEFLTEISLTEEQARVLLEDGNAWLEGMLAERIG